MNAAPSREHSKVDPASVGGEGEGWPWCWWSGRPGRSSMVVSGGGGVDRPGVASPGWGRCCRPGRWPGPRRCGCPRPGRCSWRGEVQAVERRAVQGALEGRARLGRRRRSKRGRGAGGRVGRAGRRWWSAAAVSVAGSSRCRWPGWGRCCRPGRWPRTSKVWVPSASSVYWRGEVQGSNAAPSREHSKVEPGLVGGEGEGWPMVLGGRVGRAGVDGGLAGRCRWSDRPGVGRRGGVGVAGWVGGPDLEGVGPLGQAGVAARGGAGGRTPRRRGSTRRSSPARWRRSPGWPRCWWSGRPGRTSMVVSGGGGVDRPGVASPGWGRCCRLGRWPGPRRCGCLRPGRRSWPGTRSGERRAVQGAGEGRARLGGGEVQAGRGAGGRVGRAGRRWWSPARWCPPARCSVAGVGSVLPAGSVARTSKVWEPSARLWRPWGLEHEAHAEGSWLSRRHSNRSADGAVVLSLPVNSTLAVALLLGSVGWSVIVVSGGTATVHPCEAGVGSTLPNGSTASTRNS